MVAKQSHGICKNHHLLLCGRQRKVAAVPFESDIADASITVLDLLVSLC